MDKQPLAPGVTAERDIALLSAMQAAFERHAGLYAGDPATGQIERVASFASRRAPIIHAPIVRENQARPREHRSRSRTRPARGSPDDDPSEPPRLTRAQRQALRYEVDARRRDLLRREVRLDLESGAP
jgi:hypothetical protein